MTNRLQNYINPEETERAKGNNYIETKYFGPRKNLVGRGVAYFVASENQWYFRPVKSDEWFRVNDTNLDFRK